MGRIGVALVPHRRDADGDPPSTPLEARPLRADDDRLGHELDAESLANAILDLARERE